MIVFVSKSDIEARTLDQVLGQFRQSVIRATNIEEAHERIRACDPEIVFCDTDLEGRQSWRELLAEPNTPEYLLIVVSRLANESLWAEVLNLGGFDVLALPFDHEELERVVLSAVRHSRHASSPEHRTLLHVWKVEAPRSGRSAESLLQPSRRFGQ